MVPACQQLYKAAGIRASSSIFSFLHLLACLCGKNDECCLGMDVALVSDALRT